jgi:D-sedoheptulose 7-phosphate isomerase
MQNLVDGYFDELRRLAGGVVATDGEGRDVGVAEAFGWTIETAKATHVAGNKLMFVGNGGSAAIAGHMAIDYSKNGGLRATAFNDGAALTCLGNDLGYDQVFARQIEWHARPGDLLIAISSSGRSANILNAVAEARRRDCRILTLSGFGADNPLRRLGERNLYVASREYGFVEISHLALCHAVLDLAMGWRPDR